MKYWLFLLLSLVLILPACAPADAPLPIKTVDNAGGGEGYGVIDYPYAQADGENFQLNVGETITFTWKDAPLKAERYDFVVNPLDGSMPIVLGIDTDASDGASIQWQVQPGVSGQLVGLAYFPDGRVLQSGPSGTIVSGP